MNRKYGLMLILMITFTIPGLQGQAEVIACYLNCPQPVKQINESSPGEFIGKYKFDPRSLQYTGSVAIQVDKNIECTPAEVGCGNITVKLDGQPMYYEKKSKKEVKSECREENLVFNTGPDRSYFLVVPIEQESSQELKNLFNEPTNPEEYRAIPLRVSIRTEKNITWGPGNVVLKAVNGYCTSSNDTSEDPPSPCDSLVPVVKPEISTAVQFIQLGLCQAQVKFDENNKPLPFKRKDIVCPDGVRKPKVSIPYQNGEVLLSIREQNQVDDDDVGLTESTDNTFPTITDEPLTFVQEPVKGQVPVAFKTNDNSTYWLYIAGRWILVVY